MAGTAEQHVMIYHSKWQHAESMLKNYTKALAEEEAKTEKLRADIDKLKGDIQNKNEEIWRLDRHAKNCEKATSKAQKEANSAKGNADHRINSQKGQLKNAERRYETEAAELKAWRDKYGLSVDKPAQDYDDLQEQASEWQSKAEKARNEIASLEAQIRGTPERIGLHQATEGWEEHQSCSEGFRDLEDQLHEGQLRQQKLEAALSKSRQRYQKSKTDMDDLQTKVNELEQAISSIIGVGEISEYLQRIQQLETDLEASEQQHQKAEDEKNALQIKSNQLEQANNAMTSQDKTNEYLQRIQQLETNLQTYTQHYQQAEEDKNALQFKANQLEQVNNTMINQDKSNEYLQHIQQLKRDLQTSTDRYQKLEENLKVLQEEATQQVQANEIVRDKDLTDVDMLDDEMLEKQKLKLALALKASEERHNQAQSEMKTLQEKTDNLEQLNKAFRDQDVVRNDALGKLRTDLHASREQCRVTESDMMALRKEADQLKSSLSTTREQCQAAKSNMEALQARADQLESDLSTTKAQNETTNSNMKALKEKADQLESDLKTTKEHRETANLNVEASKGKTDQLESDLQKTKEQHETTKSNMLALQEKVDQLELNLKTSEEQYQTTKSTMETLQAKADELERANSLFREKEKTERRQVSSSPHVIVSSPILLYRAQTPRIMLIHSHRLLRLCLRYPQRMIAVNITRQLPVVGYHCVKTWDFLLGIIAMMETIMRQAQIIGDRIQIPSWVIRKMRACIKQLQPHHMVNFGIAVRRRLKSSSYGQRIERKHSQKLSGPYSNVHQ